MVAERYSRTYAVIYLPECMSSTAAAAIQINGVDGSQQKAQKQHEGALFTAVTESC